MRAMFAYYMALNQWFVEPALAMRMCQESGPTLEWLIKLGVDYPVTGLPLQMTPARPPVRGRRRGPSGGADSRAGEVGTEIRLGTRVLELAAEDGAVRGVRWTGPSCGPPRS